MPGPETPFPLTPDFKVDATINGQHLHKYLGRGSYVADEIAGSVTITATGNAPNLNTIVQLVQLPLLVFPPRFALFFTDPEITLPVVQHFKVQASFHTETRITHVQVQDAAGVHSVEVRHF